MSRRTNILCFSLVCIIIAYKDIKKCHAFPFPSRFVMTAVAFICTDLIGIVAPQLATIFSVGTVAAAVVSSKFVGTCGPVSPTGKPVDTAFLTATDTTGAQPPSEQLIAPPETPQQQSIQGYQAGGIVT